MKCARHICGRVPWLIGAGILVAGLLVLVWSISREPGEGSNVTVNKKDGTSHALRIETAADEQGTSVKDKLVNEGYQLHPFEELARRSEAAPLLEKSTHKNVQIVSSPEVQGSARMYHAHASLRTAEVSNPDSEKNKEILANMVRKALEQRRKTK